VASATVLDFVVARERRRTPLAMIRDWHCNASVLLSSGRHNPSPCSGPPCLVDANWHFDVDPVRERYAVTIQREGWPPLELRSGYSDDESDEQRLRREGATDLLVSILSASFGIPG